MRTGQSEPAAQLQSDPQIVKPKEPVQAKSTPAPVPEVASPPQNTGVKADMPAVQEKARIGSDPIEAGKHSAKSLLAKGDYNRAGAALREVLAAAPADKEALRLASQVNEILRNDAAKAISSLKEERSRAENSRSPDFAPQTFTAATAVNADAIRSFSEGKYEEAAARASEAGELYARAETEARAESTVRAEMAKKNEAERALAQLRARSEAARQNYDRERELTLQSGAKDAVPDRFGEAEKTANAAKIKINNGDFDGAAHDYESAASAMRQARTLTLESARKEAVKPPEASKPASAGAPSGIPAASDSVESAQKAINNVPEQYKEAMEGKNLSLLKKIWPTLTNQQESAYKNQWAYTRSLRIQLQKSKIERLQGESATLTVYLRYEQNTDDGSNRKWNQKATFDLTRKGQDWFIEKAGFEAVR